MAQWVLAKEYGNKRMGESMTLLSTFIPEPGKEVAVQSGYRILRYEIHTIEKASQKTGVITLENG